MSSALAHVLGWRLGGYSNLKGDPQSRGELPIPAEHLATQKTNIGAPLYTDLALGVAFGSGAYVLYGF